MTPVAPDSPADTDPRADEQVPLNTAWDRWHECTGHDLDGVVATSVRRVLDALWPVGPRQLKQLTEQEKATVLVASGHLVRQRPTVTPQDAAAVIRASLQRAASDSAAAAATLAAQLVGVFDGPLGAAVKVLRSAPMPMAELAQRLPLPDDVLTHDSTNDIEVTELARSVPGGPRVLLDALVGAGRDFDILVLPHVSTSRGDGIALIRNSTAP